MKLRDILPDHPLEKIYVRTNDPWGNNMWYGHCYWTGNELISGDRDSYYLDDEVEKYEFNEDKTILTYWFTSEWVGGEDL